MSKKKKHKKHQFKYSAPVQPTNTPSSSDAGNTPPVTMSAAKKSQSPKSAVPTSSTTHTLMPHLAMVQRDVRKAIILAGGFVVAQLVLWYLLNNSSLGPSVYNLIKV
jgi:hypothetical protein